MQKTSQAIFNQLKDEISNDEVPVLLASALSAIDRHIDTLGDEVPGFIINLCNLARLFTMQFNTIRTLAGHLGYVERPRRTYLDIKSINVLIRSAHESLLTFGYLSSWFVFNEDLRHDEARFKYLCYRHGGTVDQKKNLDFRKHHLTSDFFKEQQAEAQAQREAAFAELSTHPIYASLPDEMKAFIGKGAWRVGPKRILSWNDLSAYAELPKEWAVAQYHNLSIYAHAGHHASRYVSAGKPDTHGMLMHLYIIAAYFAALFQTRVTRDALRFSDREAVIISEMIGMSRSQNLVLGKEDIPAQ
jgi:hypothetical protein